MDWNNFGKSILENIIANIPQLVLTLNVLLINIAKIKNQVKVFKGQVETTEENLTKQINVEVRTLLAHTDKRIDTSLEKFNVSLSVFNEKTEDLDNRIHNVETSQEQVLKEFMVMLDLISILVSKNPDLIKNGIAKIVVDKVNMKKQDLQKYPELISTDLDAFKLALLEQEKVIGKENLLAIIEQTLKVENYEKAEREKAKEL